MKNRLLQMNEKEFSEHYKQIHEFTGQVQEALNEKQFELYYQPIIQKDGQLACFEALIRWNHPEEGVVTPDVFLPVLENTGLMVTVGEWVVSELVAQLASWNEQYEKVKVSFNISMMELFSGDVVKCLVRNCDYYGVCPEQVIIEVTESMQSPDRHTLERLVNEIRDYGFKVALDDFGTGYASLEKILLMHPNYLKLDRIFIERWEACAESRYIIRSVIELAHYLNMLVVVEGVERPSQAESIELLGADFMQGYFYGMPAPASTVEERWLE